MDHAIKDCPQLQNQGHRNQQQRQAAPQNPAPPQQQARQPQQRQQQQGRQQVKYQNARPPKEIKSSSMPTLSILNNF